MLLFKYSLIALIIELLMFCFISEVEIVHIGILFITFGFVLLGADRMNAAKPGKDRAVLIITIYTFVSGFLLIFSKDIDKWVDTMLQKDFETEVFLFMSIFTGIFLSLGIYKGFAESIHCTKRVVGTYAGASKVGSHKGRGLYCPQFTYRYNNKNYSSIANDVYKERELRRFEQKGQVKIWINPNEPYQSVVSKMPNRQSRLILLMGVLCLWTMIYVFVIVGL